MVRKEGWILFCPSFGDGISHEYYLRLDSDLCVLLCITLEFSPVLGLAQNREQYRYGCDDNADISHIDVFALYKDMEFSYFCISII